MELPEPTPPAFVIGDAGIRQTRLLLLLRSRNSRDRFLDAGRIGNWPLSDDLSVYC
jgi:hypothetical protein